jgi:hypothetical protein
MTKPPTKIYIGNAFSLQMVRPEHLSRLKFELLELVPLNFGNILVDSGVAESIVGHADTARILGVPCNRKSVTLNPGEWLLVAQLTGGRLPEGATELPADASLVWIKVKVSE